MEGVDKEKVQKIIYELSKGSKYFENEKRKEAIIKQKIDNLRTHHAKLTEKEISHFQMVCMDTISEDLVCFIQPLMTFSDVSHLNIIFHVLIFYFLQS